MSTKRMTLGEAMAAKRTIDHAKLDATTEADIRRQMVEDREIYTPESKDDLRDGLFRGFWLHRKQKTPAMGAGALDDKENV